MIGGANVKRVLFVFLLVAMMFSLSSCMLFQTERNTVQNLSYVFKDPHIMGTYTPIWSFSTGNWVVSSPAISNDGTIYVGSVDHFLYAIDSQGKEKWHTELAGPVISSPAISNGYIYVTAASLSGISMDATGNGYLYKMSSNGSKTVLHTFPNIVGTSPVIDSNGTVYVGCLDHNVYAIGQDGKEVWKFKTNGRIGSSPALSCDESVIYFGSEDGYLYAVESSDGTQKWRYQTSGAIISSPAIDASGTVYVGSLDGYVYAVKKDGTLAWKYDTHSRIGSSPSISNETVYVGNESGNLYAIDVSNGKLKWTYKTGGYIMSSPAIDADEIVYVGSADGYLYAVKEDGTLAWKYPTGDVVGSSAAIGTNGDIYFGSNSGYVYAIRGDGATLGAGPWSMFRRDALHSAIGPSHSGLKLLGDFNKNGKLDFDDLMDFTIAWNAKSGDARYNIIYDIGPADDTNGDGVYDTAYPDGKIGFDDLMVFTMNWGKTPVYSSYIKNIPTSLDVKKFTSSKFTTFKISIEDKVGFDFVLKENGMKFVDKSGLDNDIVLIKEKGGLFEVMAAGAGKKLRGTLILRFENSSTVNNAKSEILKEACR